MKDIKLNSRKGIIVILAIIVASGFITFTFTSRKYKNDIGAYDIYTLVNLEKKLDEIVFDYDNDRLDEKIWRAYKSELLTINEYARRSKPLKFMNWPLEEIRDLDLEEISDQEIEKIRSVQQEFRRITLVISDEAGENDIGLITYRFMTNGNNIEHLNELFDLN